MKVLIVEDEQDILEVLKDFLSFLNIDFDAVLEGEKGLELIESNEYNLIFSNLRLPDISGFEIIKKARERFTDACISVISGFTDDETKEKAKEFGVNFFIEKPFSFAKIKEILDKCNDQ